MTKLEKLLQKAHQFTREEFNSGRIETENLRDEILYYIQTNRRVHEVYTRIPKCNHHLYKGCHDLLTSDYDPDYYYIHIYTLIGRTIGVDYGIGYDEYTNNRWDRQADEFACKIACCANQIFLDVPNLY